MRKSTVALVAMAMFTATLGAVFAFSPTAAAQDNGCHPAYAQHTGPCVPNLGPGDVLNCDGDAAMPHYYGIARVIDVSDDPYRLDGDNDGWACEGKDFVAPATTTTTTGTTTAVVVSSGENYGFTNTTVVAAAAAPAATTTTAATAVTVSSGDNYGFTNTTVVAAVAAPATTTTTAATPVTVSSGDNYGFTNGLPTMPAALAATGANHTHTGLAFLALGFGLLLMAVVWNADIRRSANAR